MTSVTATLKAELDRLEAEVRADPRHQKIEHLRALLRMYEVELSQPIQRLANPDRVVSAVSFREGSKRAKMKDAITDFLKERGAAHRSEILKHLTAQGIMGHEKDPMQSLAGYLSEAKAIFAFDGNGNWSLAKDSFD